MHPLYFLIRRIHLSALIILITTEVFFYQIAQVIGCSLATVIIMYWSEAVDKAEERRHHVMSELVIL